ncbi:hypothetical protein VaNZ11_008400 [Volvox africanus]|uniref:Uncharacterized protein n=1 Tax=Volvox africanus TaxID=51714 RepID=A0ABQ5S6S1_9CHLO|nr:hypothetical protein VaNZ11_008400 [Volvox africanus]
MQAGGQHAQRERLVMQERIEQLQTALSTSSSEAQQARDENKRLAAQMATTQQLLAVTETEAHELRRQLGKTLTAAKKKNHQKDIHYFNSDVWLVMQPEIEIRTESFRQVRVCNIQAAMQLQAKERTLQPWKEMVLCL